MSTTYIVGTFQADNTCTSVNVGLHAKSLLTRLNHQFPGLTYKVLEVNYSDANTVGKRAIAWRHHFNLTNHKPIKKVALLVKSLKLPLLIALEQIDQFEIDLALLNPIARPGPQVNGHAYWTWNKQSSTWQAIVKDNRQPDKWQT